MCLQFTCEIDDIRSALFERSIRRKAVAISLLAHCRVQFKQHIAKCLIKFARAESPSHEQLAGEEKFCIRFGVFQIPLTKLFIKYLTGNFSNVYLAHFRHRANFGGEKIYIHFRL